ncbi:unnamed protein product [Adineta steineri]|uniref:Uncharacterized protein n=1 Tax=Adineta steineri TaxID=433720 RepID=A0A813VR16_9BILA|nr:unnamed protein product [Adineta steineri]CAF0842250.1 unnamed protein product [Adineta steineri]CAF0911682.1 unnamed protein product [Adineta steineri]
MYCRSLLVISRLNINTSNIANRCLITSYNNKLLFFSQQQNRYLSDDMSNKRPPGRIRRFFRWFIGRSNSVESKPLTTSDSTTSLTTMQQIKRFLALSSPIERLFIRSHIIEDADLARLISKTAAVTIYAFIGITTLGTLGVDTKPLLAGIGITGFTIGFALKEVATNFISGVFLVINKPFVRGCRIKVHGGGGGIEGLVHYIDVRYVHLKTKDRGIVMIPSAVVYTNPFTVFPADDEANAGFIDMTKPPATDPTQPIESESTPIFKPSDIKEAKLKMNLSTEPAGLFKKKPLREKQQK